MSIPNAHDDRKQTNLSIHCWWEYKNYSHSVKQFLKNQAYAAIRWSHPLLYIYFIEMKIYYKKKQKQENKTVHNY